MSIQSLKIAKIKITGMTCGSCEIMLERKFVKIPGIVKAEVDYQSGIAVLTAKSDALPDGHAIKAVVEEAGYHLLDDHTKEPLQGDSSVRMNREGVLKVRIDGMNDRKYERLLREKLKLVSGVRYASVHADRGIANIYYRDEVPSWEALSEAVKSVGFRLRRFEEGPQVYESPRQKWLEIGASLLIIFALYKILAAFNIISFVSSTAGAATLGGIFLIGLVAGTSTCLAVTGGLLLSVAAKYNETNQSQGSWQKFKPLLYFNIGRLTSYFLLGGLIGILGKSITLSPRMTGYLNIVIAFVMLYLALSILKVIPKGRFGIRPPKKLSHWISSISESKHPAAPLSLGALTFFLPCGFTQSLQLIALASGSFFTGALTMFVFSLGTLPALLGISTISSTAKGKASRLFLRFAGALVLVLALFNLNSGLSLTGVDAAGVLTNVFASSKENYSGTDPNVIQEADGTQVIKMRVSAYGYSPTSFTIQGGKPTRVRAIADSDISGCTNVLTAPAFGLTKFLKAGAENELGPFTPTEDFILTCSMGMVRAKVKVIGDEGSVKSRAETKKVLTLGSQEKIPSNAQVVDLIWTSGGYSPRALEVAAGKPTVVKVSSETATGGCMSTVVFPQFNESAFVPPPGESPALITLATDQAEPGDYPITCGMGIKMGVLRVNPSS